MVSSPLETAFTTDGTWVPSVPPSLLGWTGCVGHTYSYWEGKHKTNCPSGPYHTLASGDATHFSRRLKNNVLVNRDMWWSCVCQ